VQDEVDHREERFRALFDDHFRAILAFALRRSPTTVEAADVAAETMLVAWRRIDDVPRGDQARPWLFGVARRVLANTHRAGRRRSRLVERLGQRLDDGLVLGAADSIGTTDAVTTALSRLDAHDRELLQLVAWDGLTPGDLAVVLDIPPATARTRLHRARLRLRTVLANLERDEGLEHVAVSGHVGAGGTPLPVRTKEEPQ
jgi:RNA polymerase sigma factor (sigma-70 family)